MLPIDILKRRTGSLDTQTVTSGALSSAPNRIRGFQASTLGSIVDGTSNIYAGAVIQDLYWDENGGSPADLTTFQVNGAVANSGWTQMVVDGTITLLRASAAFTQPGGTVSRWVWTNTGNPFGIVSSVHTVVFS